MFSSGFTGGVRVASGDVYGSGVESIIVGAGKGGGPQVTIYSGLGQLQSSFFAFSPKFSGGVYVSALATLPASAGTSMIVGAGPAVVHRC